MADQTYDVPALAADLEKMRERFDAACTDKSINFDKEKENVLQAITAKGKDYLMKMALGNPDSVRRAIMACAIIGITLDPASKFAYLVPRDGEVKLDISYMGLMEIAVRSGSIRFARARMVFTSDTFELGAEDEAPTHKRNPFLPATKRGEAIGVYVTVKTLQGDWLTDPMNMDEIYDIRERSPSYQGWKVDKTKKTPWVTDFPEMAKKSVVKNAYKYWPRSDRLDQAILYLNTEGGQGIELGDDGGAKTFSDESLRVWFKQVDAASTPEAVATVWKSGRKIIAESGDADAMAKFREYVAAKNNALGVQAPATTTAPTQAPSMTPFQHLCATIDGAVDFPSLETTGPMIDARPEEEHDELNKRYNARLDALKAAQ